MPAPNNEPRFAADTATRSVAENSLPGVYVGGPVTANDGDGDALTYFLSGSDAFIAIAATGQIFVAAGEGLDYETQDEYTVTLTVHDGKNAAGETDSGVDDSIKVTISVVNVDEKGTVALDPDPPQEGSDVTAGVSDPDGGVSGVTWTWERSDDGSTWASVEGAEQAAYMPTDGDIGSYLRATALYTDGVGSGKTAQATTAGVVVDATPPTVKAVNIISAPGSSGAYLSDEDIQVAVTFSEPVRIAGKPRLRLTIGKAGPYADYDHSDQGGARLVFGYTVAFADKDTDGVSIQSNALELNGGSIRDAAGNAAVLDHSGLPAGSAHLVDGASFGNADLDQVVAQMSKLRGLALPQGVSITILTPKEMQALTKGLELQAFTDREALIDNEFLRLLGFMDKNADVKRILSAQSSGLYAGLYFMSSKRIVVVSESKESLSPSTKAVLAHELVHALQDGSFGLREFVPGGWTRDDSLLAKNALVEGDASYFDRQYRNKFLDQSGISPGGSSSASASTDTDVEIPDIFWHLGSFPYDDGYWFISTLNAHGGTRRIDRAYANPPVSTEQILHPEKYLAGESPVRVTLPDVLDSLGSSWELLDSGTIGEFLLKRMLQSKLDYNQAYNSATGWGGDSYVIVRNPTSKESALVSLSAWDSTKDAQEFFAAYSNYAKAAGAGKLTTSGNKLRQWNGAQHSAHLQINGNRVLLIIGQSKSTIELISEDLSP